MIYLRLFWTFFKIGAFTFGGGYAMLPLIQEEVEANGWMNQEELINFIAVSESTPGPFAVNIATYVGVETGGFPGAVCATVGVVLPAFAVLLIVAGMYDRFQKNKVVRGMMNGMRPAVIGLVASAAVSVGMTVFFPMGYEVSHILTRSFWYSAIIFISMLILIFQKCPPILVIVLSAILGIMTGYI